MKRKSFALLFAALSAIVIMLAGNLVSAQEPPIVDPMPPRWVPGVWTNPEWLTVDFHRVRATIEAMFEEELAKSGTSTRMNPDFYKKPA